MIMIMITQIILRVGEMLIANCLSKTDAINISENNADNGHALQVSKLN